MFGDLGQQAPLEADVIRAELRKTPLGSIWQVDGRDQLHLRRGRDCILRPGSAGLWRVELE